MFVVSHEGRGTRLYVRVSQQLFIDLDAVDAVQFRKGCAVAIVSGGTLEITTEEAESLLSHIQRNDFETAFEERWHVPFPNAPSRETT